MFSFTRNLIALSLFCCISGAMAMASVPPQIEQAKKILSAEKEQWAYVQKVLNDAAQISPHHQKCALWMKHHAVASAALNLLVGLGIGAATFCGVGESLSNFGADGGICGWSGFGAGTLTGGAFVILVTRYYAQLPEWSSAVCHDVLKSFMRTWPEHREKVPHMMQGLFDGLYAQKEPNGGLSISDQQALKLIEGLMALSVAAQIA